MTKVVVKRIIEDNREDVYNYYFNNKEKAEHFKNYFQAELENEFTKDRIDEMFEQGTSIKIDSWEIIPDDNNECIFYEIDNIIKEMK